MSAKRTIYVGTFVHCASRTELDIIESGAIGVDATGTIVFVERDAVAVDAVVRKHGWEGAVIVTAGDGEFFFPGFIDTHIHASQYPNAGLFGKTTLIDWLNTYTFPLESSLSSLPKARKVYSRVIARTLSHGTTTAAYYATIHVASTNLLADLCLAAGQRAFVGRVCMDCMAPEYYLDESVEAAVRDTTACITHVRTIDPGFEIVAPIITPRFAPSCTKEMLAALGKLAQETGLRCQTHLSENLGEIELVKQLFPQCETYTDVYSTHGLLNSRMILAHVVHLSDAEAEKVKASGAKISHCPASNSALTSGAGKIRWLLDKGLTVGLGTDVSGGFSPSILEAVRQTALVSRHVAMEHGEGSKLSIEEALYLATRGGAEVVGLDGVVGGFEVGMEWDALLVGLTNVADGGEGEVNVAEGGVDIFGWESWEERVAKWVWNGDERNVKSVWVKGKLVYEQGRRNKRENGSGEDEVL